jgi:hypothetical protein
VKKPRSWDGAQQTPWKSCMSRRAQHFCCGVEACCACLGGATQSLAPDGSRGAIHMEPTSRTVQSSSPRSICRRGKYRRRLRVRSRRIQCAKPTLKAS